jgi:anti-sigma B factor antagonist
MSLSIASRSVGDITVLTCTGRIVEGDESTALESSVKNLLPMQPCVVLDVGAVTSVDSSGLGLLLRLRTLTRAATGDLKLCGANHHVRDVLRVTKLSRVLPPYDSELEAITAFYAPGDVDDPWTPLDVDVLCVHSSVDVLAYAREVLKQAGYGVATTSNVSDGRVLLRATTAPVLVIDSDSRARIAALAGEDPGLRCAVISWPANISTEDPGDAARELLDGVNRALAGHSRRDKRQR